MSYPIYEQTYTKDIKVGDKTITIEIGKFGQQAAAAVLARCGDTVVHSTIGLGREVDWGYFPLSVEFSEKLYASGIIKGSRWVKREGRPTDDSILKARIIDRTIRPLFPEGIKNEVQVINTVFSYDQENDPDMLGLVATAIALAISPIPFDGPVAGVRVGYDTEKQSYLINPTHTERESSDLDLIVSGTGDSVVMVEAGANEVTEQVVLEGMQQAQQVLGKVCQQIDQIVKDVGKEKVSLVKELTEEEVTRLKKLTDEISSKFSDQIKTAVQKKALLEEVGLDDLRDKIYKDLNVDAIKKGNIESEIISEKEITNILDKLMKAAARSMILDDGVRPDGRKVEDIRQIWCEIDIFPRAHGSAMFKRGATQAATVTTLGNPSLGQVIEDLDGESVRHYIHHYNSPPFSFGTAGRMGWPKRREIGHGALAERALFPMIPSQEDFPYTIRVVSEILSSNGSTSQASVCGSTLSLMAAGVPIKKPVSGIAMGLMTDGKGKYVILSDIQGLEDHVGDMDFKVAGSKDGITAIQMDIKLKGLPVEILEKALEQARVGRLHILDEMMKCLAEPKTELSQYAPKVRQLTIPIDRIGELIGPGGKVIKNIIEASGAEVNVDEDDDKQLGVINVSSSEQAEIDQAVKMIEDIMRVVEEGDEFDGKVVRIENYGAFVEYLPGRDGLVHVSQMSTEYVDDPNKLVGLGDEVHVRVSEIKDDGKIGLSMLTEEQAAARKSESRGGGGRFSGRRDRFEGSYRGRDRRGGNDRRQNRGNSRGGDRRRGQNNNRGGRDRNDRSPRFKPQI